MNIHDRYIFRTATVADTKELADIEKICFPENELCSYENMKDRVDHAAEDFLIAYDQVNRKIAGYLSGIHSSSEAFLDAFFTNASLQEDNAKNCYLLSLEVRPEYRRKGIASQLIERYRDKEKTRGTATSTSVLPLLHGEESPGKIWFYISKKQGKRSNFFFPYFFFLFPAIFSFSSCFPAISSTIFSISCFFR